MPTTIAVIVPAALLVVGPTVSLHLLTATAGSCLAAAGLFLFGVTFGLFLRVGQGTLAPWRPTQHLVIVGPYRRCRNPMISGVLGVLLGEALFFESWTMLAYAAAFVVVNTIYFKLSEEPDLERKHGEEYRRYRRAVPMWLPRAKPYDGAETNN